MPCRGLPHEVEGVHDRSTVIGGDGFAHPLFHVVAQGDLRPVPGVKPAGHACELFEIARANRPAGTAQQADEFRPRSRIVNDLQGTHKIDDLRGR